MISCFLFLVAYTSHANLPFGSGGVSDHNVALRVVSVTPNWHDYALETGGGWPSALTNHRESQHLKYYEAAIWQERNAVHLYAFPNNFDFMLQSDDPQVTIQNREQYRIAKYDIGPDARFEIGKSHLSLATSKRIAEIFALVGEELVERHPDSNHHFIYRGHGAFGGELVNGAILFYHADLFL